MSIVVTTGHSSLRLAAAEQGRLLRCPGSVGIDGTDAAWLSIRVITPPGSR
jgi:hypothetical protein